VCEQLTQGCIRKAEQPGLELATYWLLVRALATNTKPVLTHAIGGFGGFDEDTYLLDDSKMRCIRASIHVSNV